ncbi:MAG: LacI family DNA-binding transcriptional regulator [Mesotoga sp.]|nr:LacI family DNA-binding transcriptional regulator [Mesotoga sp.]MCP5457601.1 LacI family DNA-binding transcriptional regulator [Thermotogota bacterium]HPA00506.1 LacI family DNA-binding transcriptional regulator [Mesotoga prima]
MKMNANVCERLRSPVMKKTTIKDIANELNISPSSVSRALSDEPGVSPSLRKEIVDAAERLNYIPNSSAKSLKTRKTQTVGLIVSDIRNPFFLDFMSGVETVLFPRGYKFIVCDIGEDFEKERIYIKWLLEHGVEGILSSPCGGEDGRNNSRLYREAVRRNIPVVFYDRILEGLDRISSVTLDNRQAILQGVLHLKENGHRKLGIVLHKKGIYTIEERRMGFLEACKMLDIEINADWIIENAVDAERASLSLESVLKSDRRPDAIISTNQFLNEVIVATVRRMGLKIPGDLSIVGFDDHSMNELIEPPLTTIRQPVKDIGRIAATIMLSEIDGTRGDKSKVVLKAELLQRKSVSKLI